MKNDFFWGYVVGALASAVLHVLLNVIIRDRRR